MKMAVKKKRGAVLAAFLVLLILAAAPREAHGALRIDTDADCSMTFSLSNDYGELGNISIPVTVRKVASVGVNGAYTPLEGYGELGFEGVSSTTNAAAWEEMAKKAAEIAVPGCLGADGKKITKQPKTVTADLEIKGSDAETARKLELSEPGLYLVMAYEVESREYTYAFSPYLVALPGNEYASLGNGYGTGTDAWDYEIDVTLKPEQAMRYGSLEITKTLNTYRAGDSTPFIFQIEATKSVNNTDIVVYSDVVQLVFDGPGVNLPVRVEKIPAQAKVTVTEIYSGAGYSGTGPYPANPITIVADETQSVSFTNSYNNELRGGSGIQNHFEPVYEVDTAGLPVVDEDGKKTINDWTWTPTPAQTQTQ